MSHPTHSLEIHLSECVAYKRHCFQREKTLICFLHGLSLELMQNRHCDVIYGMYNTLGQCSVLLLMDDLLYMVAEGF